MPKSGSKKKMGFKEMFCHQTSVHFTSLEMRALWAKMRSTETEEDPGGRSQHSILREYILRGLSEDGFLNKVYMRKMLKNTHKRVQAAEDPGS